MAVPDYVKPYQLEDAKNIDASGSVMPDTSALETYIQDRFNTYKADIFADYPPDYSAAEPGITTLLNDILAHVSTDIPAVTYTASLEDVKQELETEIASERPYTCAQCAGEGVIPTYEPDGTPTGEYNECPLCTGFGATEVQYKKDPNDQNNYIPA